MNGGGSDSGVMFLDGVDVSLKNPAERRVVRMGFIPEERNGHAAVPSMSLAENALLTSHSLVELVRLGVLDSFRHESQSKRDSQRF